MKTIYLDNGASTRVDPEVARVMADCLSEKYGNASSLHHKGEEAKGILESARHTIAKSIGAKDSEIIFTSGGTESNNFALKGVVSATKGKHIIVTRVEHDCILNSAKWLEKQGVRVTYLGVDSEGFVSASELEKAICPDIVLVSVIHGNNEIGTIQNLKELYNICRKKNVYFHTDACQSYMKTALSARDADLITLNAHKIHGPKGVGALYVKTGVRIECFMHGGGHERGLRGGTENIPGVAGFAKAVLLADKKYIKHMDGLRDYFISGLLKMDGVVLNGPAVNRLCNNVNVSFRGIEGESLGALLNAKGICTSTGSACSSRSLEPSHVIMAICGDVERAHGSVRFSLSRFNTREEIEFALDEIRKAVSKLRAISPFGKAIGRL